MLRSHFLLRSVAARCRPACSSTAALQRVHREKSWRRDGGRSEKGSSRSRWWSRVGATAAPLLGMSWITTLKDLLGLTKFQLDEDPIKDKVKESWLCRKYKKYDKAVEVLHGALEMAQDRKEAIVITRIYDELANTYYEMGNLEDAEKLFRLVIHRLMELHGKRESDAEFIGISLKLADIFAQKGQLDNAETGYMHCVTKQLKVVEENMKKYIVTQGAIIETHHLVESFGPAYTDPLALFGMCLEQFAHFLVNYRDEGRLAESAEYIDESLKISYQIFGPNSSHSIHILNNYGAALNFKHRFEMAAKYLEIGVKRILYVDECSGMIPGYYCNYAEALFHCGKQKEALEYAQKAVHLSNAEEPRVKEYAKKFLRDLEADIRRKDKSRSKGWLW